MSDASIIEVSQLTKCYGQAKALDNVSLTVEAGEMVALIGASGSGKSTLLRILAGFIEADRGSGRVRVAGHLIQSDGKLSPRVRRARADIGFIFQQFNLVGRLSVLTNVLIGALARTAPWRACLGWFTAASKAQAAQALMQVGILEHSYKRASDLSGGQQQRVAIARAMVQGARVILADEPIASLDPESARNVMQTLAELNGDGARTVLVSLHQVGYARRFCRRTIALRQGVVVYDGPSAALTRAMLSSLYGGDAAGLEMDADEDSARAPSAAALACAEALRERAHAAAHVLAAT